MKSFKNFHYSQKPICFTEAIKKQQLLSNTDADRSFRGKMQVRVMSQPRVIGKRGDPQRLEYITKAKPSTEQKTHHGYVVYDRETDEIHELFCDCSDFFYRSYAPFVKKGLANFDLSAKFNKKLIRKHNKQWTKETNPSGSLFLCKHLFKIVSKYI